MYQETLETLSALRNQSEEIIRRDGLSHLVDGVVSTDVIKTLIEIEKANPGQVNNWILVFNWKTASFVTWDFVSLNPEEAVKSYARYESQFPENENYEVVLIGSSDIATVQKTHGHYFGITGHDKILEEFGQTVRKITDDVELNKDARNILSRLHRRKVWGMNKGVQRQTLKNHFCKDVSDFERSVELLISLGYLLDKGGAGVTLNTDMSKEIYAVL